MLSSLFNFCRQVWSEFNRDKAGQMCAAFAYVAIFAIGPLLLVLVSLAGLVFGQHAIEGQLFEQLHGVVGADTAQNLQELMVRTHQSDKSTVALVIGLIGITLAASGLSGQLQTSFNTIFRAVPDPKAGIKVTIYTRAKNILLLVLGGLVVVGSVILSVLINGLGDNLEQYVAVPPSMLELLNTGASLFVFIGILYMLYRTLPDVVLPRGLVLSTSIIVGTLFLIGKVIVSMIIGRNGTAGAYGAAASVIVLMLWFYYSAQILLLGTEGIKTYGLNRGLEYVPKRFTLKRHSLDVDLPSDVRGRTVDAFARGYRKKPQK